MNTQDQRSPAEHAVMHILKRLKADPRLAYLIGPGSESFELLMVAGAGITSHEVDSYRELFLVNLTVQPQPAIGELAAVIAPELLARISTYNDNVHDLDDQMDLDMLANHFLKRGLDVAEAERDSQTVEMF